MNKSEFLSSLNRLLSNLPEPDRQEILYDYEEHFRSGIEAGKTEQEVAASLGSPEAIVKLFRADILVERSQQKASPQNLLRAILAVMGLGLFNVIVMAGPFVAMIAVLIAFLATSVAVILGGLAVFIVYPLQHLAVVREIGSVSLPGVMITAMGFVSLGLLLLIGSVGLARVFYRVVVQYLKTNLAVIRGK